MDSSVENRIGSDVEASQGKSLDSSLKSVLLNRNIVYIITSTISAVLCQGFYLHLPNSFELSSRYEYLAYFSPLIILIVILNGTLIFVRCYPRILANLSKRIRSKSFLLAVLIVFNIILFIMHVAFFTYKYPIEIIDGPFLKYIARAGLSWLYIFPYNIFLFFPLFISIYFRKFKYPERYLSTFFDAVLHENVGAVVLGLLLNVILSAMPIFFIIAKSIPQNSSPEIFEMKFFHVMAFFQVWAGSLIIWLTPFLASLTQLEAKFEASFDRKLRSIIQEMEDHVVVIGYGDLGKKICSNLIEEGIVSSEEDFIEILYPDLEVRKIYKSLLVVDIDDQWFDHVHRDPILGKIGVARDKIRIKGKKEDILIPAIIGDIKSEAVREGSNLRNSNLFILASADYAATFTMSKFANRVDANSIIAVRDSAQKDYFSPKMTAHDTFFVYPTFQAGISLGRILSLCYFKLTEKMSEGDSPRIVIAGEGKQIHYLIETFWIEMKGARIAEHWTEQETFELPITILTEDRNLVRCHNVSEPPKRGKYIEVKGILTRLTRIDKINAWMLIDLVFDAPHKLKTIEKIINKEKPKEKPKVIVITSKTSEDVSKILHEWIVAIERYNSKIDKEFYKPMIVVGVLGDEYMEIQDILLYYSKIESMYGKPLPEYGTQFPTHMDSTVRVYDDTAEQISGLAYAFIRTKKSKGKTEYKDPFVLYCCLKDVWGSLGYILGKLACIEFKDHEFKGVNRLLPIDKAISLRFCRYQNCPDEDRYSFLANAELETKTDVEDEDRISHCLFQGKINGEEGEKNFEYIKENLGLIGYGLSENRNLPFVRQLLRKTCSRCNQRIICPLSSYLRKVMNLIENRNNYEVLEELGRINGDTMNQEISRFLVNPGFSRSGPHSEPKKPTPRAIILMCCKSEIPGSLAAAVNSLLFKEIDVKKSRKTSSKSANRVTAVAYVKSSGCYDPESSCFEFYGNFADREPEKIYGLKEKGVIDLVLISAVTEKQEWWDYANDLLNVLNGNSRTGEKNKYKLLYDRKNPPNSSSKYEDYPDNIAIIREGHCGELSFDCSKRDCTVYYKLRLIEKSGT